VYERSISIKDGHCRPVRSPSIQQPLRLSKYSSRTNAPSLPPFATASTQKSASFVKTASVVVHGLKDDSVAEWKRYALDTTRKYKVRRVMIPGVCGVRCARR